ncbi:MAG: FAD-dependent monooxygenase [Chloroflexi bacterium]|nr:FAD-dependent monooxygenase [Chloroflexota bacterium]
MPQHDFDLIIVGGRVAGSALAVQLGRAGLKVLLVERGRLPSKHPASSPIIGPSSMQLLDELGAAESDYAHNTPLRAALSTTFAARFASPTPWPIYTAATTPTPWIACALMPPCGHWPRRNRT